MAVRIRLKKMGKKKKAFYRLVAAESKNSRDGKVLEELGHYDPQQEPVLFDIKKDRVQHWMSVGAKPSDPVERLLGNAGLLKETERKSANQGVSKKDRKKETED